MKESNNEILFKKFEILSCYKKDEHSAVYLANHIYLEKKVFLKVLNIKTIPDSSIVERFKQEAKILAQLEHPNIIKVFDFGMFENFFYISFEYFESKNLREVLKSSSLPKNERKEIFIQLVKGLDYAHKKNVVHRDIKPENILINEKNEVKLTDFGLAQDSLSNLITQQYSVVGTPAYMSPEQIQGEKLTFKSDLFSLGITAAELFSGKNLFLGEDTNETINNILSFDERENSDFYENFSDEIKNVLKGLLASNPNKRFNSCEEILKIFNVENTYQEKKKNKNTIWIILIVIIGLIIIIWNSTSLINSSNNVREVESKKISKSEKNVDSLIEKSNLDSNKNKKPETQKIITEQSQEPKMKISAIRETNNSHEKIKSVTKNFGELYVKCYPWAKVYLNNKYLETTPFSENIRTKSGKYLLTLVHPEYPKYSDSIKINPEELTFVEINLDTLFGYLDCQVYPWSEIYINDVKKGVTPLNEPLRLTEGKYKLTLVNPSYNNIEKEVKITKHDTLKLKFNMKY